MKQHQENQESSKIREIRNEAISEKEGLCFCSAGLHASRSACTCERSHTVPGQCAGG